MTLTNLSPLNFSLLRQGGLGAIDVGELRINLFPGKALSTIWRCHK